MAHYPQTPAMPGTLGQSLYGTSALPFRPTYNWKTGRSMHRQYHTRRVEGPGLPNIDFWKRRYYNARKARINAFAAMSRARIPLEIQRMILPREEYIRDTAMPYYRKWNSAKNKKTWHWKNHNN
ncbi:hypothetical protein [Geminiviridae sp.]|nr:hypothetical protein [Geminiviridae sp.]